MIGPMETGGSTMVFVSADTSDAAENLADALNQGSISGWDVVAAIIVVVLSVPIARLVAAAVRRAFKRGGIASSDAGADVAVAAKWIVYLLGFAIAASILGVNIGFLSVLFVFALVIGALALKPMIENSASGVLLLARPAFSVGDQIQTTEFRGVVEEIGSRSTKLRQSDGVVVYVSNNQVLGNPIVVYNAQDSRKGTFDIAVPSDTDLDDLTSTLMTAIGSVDDVVADPAPAVQATALTDNAITLNISYWYPSTSQTGATAADGVIRSTMEALSQAGIELAVPVANLTEGPSDETAADSTEGDASDTDTSDEKAGSGDET
jgi:small-conductance mechanosensitive channel